MSETGKAFEELVEIMTRLRGENGCPWDHQQTHESLKKYMIEETYEAVDAVDSGDMNHLREELGDVLLQVIFHAEIARENGVFDIDDVVEGISSKLLRRHPHVFGDTQVECAEEVLQRWDQIKAGEKGHKTRSSILDSVPRSLPALARAMEISKRAARAGFEWPNTDAVIDKVHEEVSELQVELESTDQERISDEVGDLLFTIVNVARWRNVDPEDALRRMIDRFTARFRRIEETAVESGRSMEEMTIEEMDAVWHQAKTESR
jgi:tetrapyrrole methylase family protein/MazG family protein